MPPDGVEQMNIGLSRYDKDWGDLSFVQKRGDVIRDFENTVYFLDDQRFHIPADVQSAKLPKCIDGHRIAHFHDRLVGRPVS